MFHKMPYYISYILAFCPSSFSPLLFIKYQLHDKHSVNEKTDMLLAFMKLTFSGERREGGIWGEGRGEAAVF